MQHQRAQVLSHYRQLIRLIRRLPADKAAAAQEEARAAMRERSGERDPLRAHDHLKELAARVSFLRMTTPRPAGEPVGSGRFVFRGGEWVEGEGEDKGARWVWRVHGGFRGQPMRPRALASCAFGCDEACRCCTSGARVERSGRSVKRAATKRCGQDAPHSGTSRDRWRCPLVLRPSAPP